MSQEKTPSLTVEVVRLAHGCELDLPTYQSSGASGLDMLAAVAEGEQVSIHPGARALVPTGISMAIPQGFEAQVRPRSGLAARHGVTVLNTPGTIDSDYRGEIKIILINHGQETFVINRGERIAQLIVQKIERIELIEVQQLPSSKRGRDGFGSTGRS